MRKATQQQTKEHNKRLILKTIYEEEAISRANIARSTGLTRTTVSNIVSELIEDGLVEEVGFGPSQGGKPPILLSMIAQSRQVIGVDLGNSELRGGLFDLRGRLLHSIDLPVNGRTSQDALELVYQLVDTLVAAKTKPLLGIGIGTPGLTDTDSGVVYEAVNLGWQDLPVQSLLETRYNQPVNVANDSQLAALGEYTFGLNQPTTNLVVVKAGQGISAGIVLNGRLYYGDNSGPGEIGHVMVVDGGKQCVCGHYGCLETVANSNAIIEQTRAIAQKNTNSLLHQLAPTPDDINTDVVLQAFHANDAAVQQIICEVGHYLGIAVAHLVAILNIQHVVIGGRMARFGDCLLDPIRQEVKQRVLWKIADETEITLSDLGPDIVTLGAAAFVLSHELGVV